MSKKERKSEKMSRQKKEEVREKEGGEGKEGKKEKRKGHLSSPMGKNLNMSVKKQNIQRANMKRCSTNWSPGIHKLKPQ